MESVAATSVENSSVASSVVFTSLLVAALVLWYIYHRLNNQHFYDLGSKLPGPTALPFIGNGLEFLGVSTHDIFEKIYSRTFEYIDILRMWIGPNLLVFLSNPKDIELILGSNVHIDKSPEYRFFQPWLGDGLLISTGDKWRAHRKLIAPTFHLNVLKSFVDLFNVNSRGVVEKLRHEVGTEFDCHDYMSECTVDILLETAMGVNKKTQGKSGFDYAMAVIKMCNILHLRQVKLWLRPDFIFRYTQYGKEQTVLLNTIHSLTKAVIRTKKEDHLKFKKYDFETLPAKEKNAVDDKKCIKMKESPLEPEDNYLVEADDLREDNVLENDIGTKKRTAFLDFMIEHANNGEVLSDDEIKEEVDTIMFEGHDTTAAASSFFLCLMAAHSDVQEMCHQEMDRIFGDSDRTCTYTDTLEMKYLERCILETLRLYPPVPVISREIHQDLPLASKNLVVPARSTVVVTIFKLHRRPDIYPNPEVFDPDNFLPDKMASRPFYSYIPFAAGPRSCVGRKYAMIKLKVILSTILRNFKVVGGKKESDWKLQADVILKRTDGFNIRIEPRNNVHNTGSSTSYLPEENL